MRRRKVRLGRHQIKRWAFAAFLLIGLSTVKAFWFKTPLQADAYHSRISAAAAAVPSHFGSWVSVDVPVPPAAMTMLRPNVAVSRRYTDLNTGQQATLLLIQCRDARDLFGHYPPVCYAAHGFHAVESVPRDWSVDGLAIHGMSYTFSSTSPEDPSSMVVYDFMILPNGTTCRDLDGVYASARDPRKRKLGAAQLQVLIDSNVSAAVRDAEFSDLIKSNRPTIDAILAGDRRQ
jgi:hypothetical protein